MIIMGEEMISGRAYWEILRPVGSGPWKGYSGPSQPSLLPSMGDSSSVVHVVLPSTMKSSLESQFPELGAK